MPHSRFYPLLAGFLPASVTVSVGELTRKPTRIRIPATCRSGGFGVGSSLTIFAGFSNINRLRAAKLSRLMGWEETENQANQIAIQVMNAFFTLLYAEEEVRITQEQVENSRLRLKRLNENTS